MEIGRDTNSPAKSTILLLTISLTVIILPLCNSKILTNMEGESIELDFPYPCNISRVTFQYGNRAPSYDSANPTSVSLPSTQNLTIKDESQNNQCALHLTINPVSRNDAGTYILTGYDGNGDYVYDTRVGLRVNYPPGKASCESSDPYIAGEWIRLHCSAQAGNIAGQIICYQNDIRLPPLTSPDESEEILRQSMLAKSGSAALIYCCSSTLQTIEGRCDCKDSGWDPVQNALTSVLDPCPDILSTMSPTKFPTSSLHRPENVGTIPSSTADSDYKRDKIISDLYDLKVLGGLSTVTVIITFVFLTCTRIAVRRFMQRKYNFCIKKYGDESSPSDCELQGGHPREKTLRRTPSNTMTKETSEFSV